MRLKKPYYVDHYWIVKIHSWQFVRAILYDKNVVKLADAKTPLATFKHAMTNAIKQHFRYVKERMCGSINA